MLAIVFAFGAGWWAACRCSDFEGQRRYVDAKKAAQDKEDARQTLELSIEYHLMADEMLRDARAVTEEWGAQS